MPDTLRERLQAALGTSYTLERELSGGMSRVFVAMEAALARRVVVKVLPPERTYGVNVDRFRREIQVAAQLQHPHIVPVLSAGDADGGYGSRSPDRPAFAERHACTCHRGQPDGTQLRGVCISAGI